MCCPPGFILFHVPQIGKGGGSVGVITRGTHGYAVIDLQGAASVKSFTVLSSGAALPLIMVIYEPQGTLPVVH